MMPRAPSVKAENKRNLHVVLPSNLQGAPLELFEVTQMSLVDQDRQPVRSVVEVGVWNDRPTS